MFVKGPLPFYATDVVPVSENGGMPLMELAWAGLSDEELVERLAVHVWRAPLLGTASRNQLRIGQVGISGAKARRYVDWQTKGVTKEEQGRLTDLVVVRAKALLHKQLCKWATEVFDAADGDINETHWNIQAIVPKGCRTMVLETIASAVKEQKSAIFKSLNEAKCKPVR